MNRGGKCPTYQCEKEKGVRYCFKCNEFPCLKLAPSKQGADRFPHNFKLFNLCRRKTVGVETWAEEEYFKLYDYTVSAIKSVLPETQVGGNAVTHSKSKGTPFLIGFIEHCLRGTNFKDSSIGRPLDFISFHLKGTNFEIKKIGNFTSDKLPFEAPKFSPNIQCI